MPTIQKSHQTARELGKIYQSFFDKELLAEFYLENVAAFTRADSAYLYLAGKNDELWLFKSHQPLPELPGSFLKDLKGIFEKGKPVFSSKTLFIPLVVRNAEIGIACFLKNKSKARFSKSDFVLASDLSQQIAGALKNLLLHDENLKMERLAAIGQTMGYILHEIKNIIQLTTFSQGYLKMGMAKSDPALTDKGLSGMDKSIKDMHGFVSEILSLTKDYKISPQKFSLAEIFKELENDLAGKSKEQNTRLQFQIDDNFPETEGEPRSLYRALLNLIKNAMEAADKPEAYVRVRAMADKKEYEIRIEDNGQGMTDEVKAKLFTAFFSTKGEKGTGLGMMIIDRTIRAHSGKIEVESKLRQGTTFRLILPYQLPKP